MDVPQRLRASRRASVHVSGPAEASVGKRPHRPLRGCGLCPPTELSFTWVVDDFLNTRVSYRLEADGSGTRVLFEHSGFDQKQAFKGAEYGWTMMHGQLEKILEQGSEQR